MSLGKGGPANNCCIHSQLNASQAQADKMNGVSARILLSFWNLKTLIGNTIIWPLPPVYWMAAGFMKSCLGRSYTDAEHSNQVCRFYHFRIILLVWSFHWLPIGSWANSGHYSFIIYASGYFRTKILEPFAHRDRLSLRFHALAMRKGWTRWQVALTLQNIWTLGYAWAFLLWLQEAFKYL